MSNPDPMPRRKPAGRWIGGLLFLLVLGVYLATLNWAPPPGPPTRALLAHLGVAAEPVFQDLLWGMCIRGLARLPRLPMSAWAALFSAVCGAGAVALLGLLMGRIGFRHAVRPVPAVHLAREDQARLIAACTAAFYLAFGVPFWVVATTPQPAAFHLFLLLLAGWALSTYRRSGRWRVLLLLGLGTGVGLTEFATFYVLLVPGLMVLIRAMFKRRELFNWRPLLLLGLGLAAGLALYPLQAELLFRRVAHLGGVASPWQVWGQILTEQARLIAQAPYRNPVFLAVLCLAGAMWLTVFAFSHRSPWYYEADQVLVRVALLGALLFVLGVVRFAWKQLGLANLMLTPHLLLAACAGFLAGEFWIMGQAQPLGDDSAVRRMLRRGASALGAGLPLLVLAVGALNARVVDGRYSRIAQAAAEDVLARLAGRDIVFTTSLFEDSLALAAWQRRVPVLVINLQRTSSETYMRHLARRFPDPDLQKPLRAGEIGSFLDVLLFSPAGVARTAFIDMHDVFREYAHVSPDGYLCRLEVDPRRAVRPALVQAQGPFWAQLAHMAAAPVPAQNWFRAYQDDLRRVASKQANTVGVMLAEAGDLAGAEDAFRAARAIFAENASALLNLRELSRRRTLAGAAQLEQEWESVEAALEGERWALGLRFGPVWNAREWARRGLVWAMSGTPVTAEAIHLQAGASDAAETLRTRLVDQVHLVWDRPAQSELAIRGQLMRDPRDAAAFMDLSRLALHRNDPELAAAYVDQALLSGRPEQDTRLERALIDRVAGKRAAALAAFEACVRQQPGDPRGWVALALLTPPADPRNAEALARLQEINAPPVALRLVLAWIHLNRFQWAEARAELEQAARQAPRNQRVWEMLASLAQIRMDRKLRASSMAALQACNPRHPMLRVPAASDQFRSGRKAEAQAGLEDGLRLGRDPEVLHALAYIAMARQGDPAQIRAWLDEAIQKLPYHPMFRATRGELNLQEGHLDAAQRDLKLALAALPEMLPVRLLVVQLLAASGETEKARALAKVLSSRWSDFSPSQQQTLQHLLQGAAPHE